MGMLHLASCINRNNTCYYMSEPKLPQATSVVETASQNYCFPSIQAELGVLVAQLAGTTQKRVVSQAFEAFDSKTENELNFINKGLLMLLEAHHEVIHTLKQTLEKEVHDNISEDIDERPTTRRKKSHDPVPAVEFLVPANGHAESAHVAELPILAQGSETTAGKPSNSKSHSKVVDVDFVVPVEGHADPIRDGDLLALTQQPEPTEDNPLNSDSHKEENCSKEDAALLVDAIIDMIDASVAPEPIDTLQPELDGAFAYAQEDNAENSSQPNPTDHTYDQQDREGPGSNDEAVNAFQGQPSTDTSDDHLGPVLMRLCTQQENLLQATFSAPSKRITKVPSKYISPFKGTLVCPKVSSTKAIAVRKKFCTSLKSSSDSFIIVGSSVYNGKDIFESFGDANTLNMLSSRFMATFVRCMKHDEESNMPDGGGYRVFLPLELVEMINIDKHKEDQEWPFDAAESLLQRYLTQIAPHKVKLYFLPILENDEWSVYCINMIHKRIDILDSSAANHGVYHEIIGDRIIPRLNALFQEVTNGRVKDFAKWRRPIRHIAEQTFENDSGFFAARFMQLWDGDALTTPVIPDRITQMRAELLYYLLYHPLNEKKKLPAGLEAFRPRP